ncbi:DegT/DnrJ/EryC1/StrS family aminotransferase [Candidatus Lucifugimonas marina]|uniref:Aminotransferase class I/II-fold pyridoxal phosphate-dependent enzyme n=1 Tax=Candidatus Lucifugimonas marina TaxID=3038979 RepID=A0AAJ5ZHE7_9CHLR|nr:aminotransferase class I/II-fold pyridoxal phosphate-dependent enzyme [SAR202 cluster bacterium JH702]MDG0868241.1 aminotransferase class I/II-fold pyridoxal phosphate-dependent enzyme [SAR202 cluster bacterium JH639]WFG34885.1 aminotransferase class I/II-fold pyridoxal phosphate-dependent enzyme [SAR202 cluster bacterium JH545]WFG38836.1 aminotransferase class I/II-fold pyridoxal phosphate-dependent enzyme [SAR202 cluster bacterium JH1073]
MNIPFMRLDRQFEQHKDAIMALCEQVFSHGRVLQGPEVANLENQLCDLMGTTEAVAVGSATDALFFALIAAGIKSGDAVAVPAMTFVATASPVIRAGAKPVFVDTGDNFQPDVSQLIDLVNSGSVQAVVAAHLYGQLFDITPLADACRANGIVLIEDAAQGIGATYNGSAPGAQSFAASLSFDPMKVAGAFGSGGAIVTNNSAAAERIKRLRYHGRDKSRSYQELGYNSQLASIQAAIVGFKLEHLDEWTERRQQIARRYTAVLDEISSATPPLELPEARHVFHKYVLTAGADRDRLKKHLAAAGVGTMIHYASPLHREPMFAEYLNTESSFPEADRLSREALSLPMYPELDDTDVDHVCDQLTRFGW